MSDTIVQKHLYSFECMWYDNTIQSIVTIAKQAHLENTKYGTAYTHVLIIYYIDLLNYKYALCIDSYTEKMIVHTFHVFF